MKSGDFIYDMKKKIPEKFLFFKILHGEIERGR